MSEADKILKDVEEENQRKEEIESAIEDNSSFYNKELPPANWIAGKLIPTGITILSSPPGRWKSWLMLKVAIDVAKGESVFGQFNSDQKNVLFINEEMNELLMQDRLKMLTNDIKLPIWHLNLFGIKLGDIDTKILVEFCKEKNIKVVIFDSLIRVSDYSENDSGQAKKIFEQLLMFVREDISCLLTHHHRKENPLVKAKDLNDSLRGSTDILAQIDCHLGIDIVDTERNYLTIKQAKIRSAEALPDIKIDIIKDDGKIDFKYNGFFSFSDLALAKAESCRDDVLKIIEDNPEIIKEEIIKLLDGQIGQREIQKILPKLESEGVIFTKTKKPKKYQIKDQISELF